MGWYIYVYDCIEYVEYMNILLLIVIWLIFFVVKVWIYVICSVWIDCVK